MARLPQFVRDVPRDARLIYAAAFVRALANGLIGVLLAIYLAELSLAPAQIGVVASAGLAGATLALLAVTLAGDRLGRRRVLFAVNLLGALFGALLAITHSPAIV